MGTFYLILMYLFKKFKKITSPPTFFCMFDFKIHAKKGKSAKKRMQKGRGCMMFQSYFPENSDSFLNFMEFSKEFLNFLGLAKIVKDFYVFSFIL